MIYWIKYNISIVDGEEVDERADAWEQEFLDIAEASDPAIEDTFYYTFRRYKKCLGHHDAQCLQIFEKIIFDCQWENLALSFG